MKSTTMPTLFAMTLALATLLLLEPTANALVHRLPLSHLRMPENAKQSSHPHAPMSPLDRADKLHAIDRATLQYRKQLEREAAAASSDSAMCSGGGAQSDLSAEYDIWGWLVITAEASVGTPGQGPFAMEIDFYSDRLYVLGAKAKYEYSGGLVDIKQMFNSSVSSTYAAADDSFSATNIYLNGTVGVDVLSVGSLNANLSMQVTTLVDPWINQNAYDGTLGLALIDDSSLVKQLAPQLDSPVLTFHTRLPWTNYRDNNIAANFTGVLSIGDLLADKCNSDTWTSLARAEFDNTPVQTSVSGGLPYFNITSISAPPSSDACDNTVVANITVAFVPYFQAPVVSYQVMQVFVKASGAEWDEDKRSYVAANVTSAQPVTFQLANGGSIQLTSDDYLLEYNGVQYLNVYESYDQNQYGDIDYIVLDQQFLNNRCLSMNLNSGVWSIASALKQVESVYNTSSGSGSSSSEANQ